MKTIYFYANLNVTMLDGNDFESYLLLLQITLNCVISDGQISHIIPIKNVVVYQCNVSKITIGLKCKIKNV